MRQLNRRQMKNLFKWAAAKYDVNIVELGSKEFPRVVRALCRKANVNTRHIKAATDGKNIYLRFNVGNFGQIAPKGQVAILLHELGHVFDVRRDGWFRYVWRYLTSSYWRAVYEAEAYCMNYEFYSAIGLDVSIAPYIKKVITNYRVNKKHWDVVDRTMRYSVVRHELEEYQPTVLSFLKKMENIDDRTSPNPRIGMPGFGL